MEGRLPQNTFVGVLHGPSGGDRQQMCSGLRLTAMKELLFSLRTRSFLTIRSLRPCARREQEESKNPKGGTHGQPLAGAQRSHHGSQGLALFLEEVPPSWSLGPLGPLCPWSSSQPGIRKKVDPADRMTSGHRKDQDGPWGQFLEWRGLIIFS